MLDLILAVAHHLAVFVIVGLLFAELVLVRPGLPTSLLRRIAGLDGAYGAAALAVIVVGVARVVFGDKGWDYYALSHAFWAKMGLFVLVGLLSIIPTLGYLRWRRAAAADGSFLVPDHEVARARRYIHIQLAILFLIPIAAAAMARGY